MSQPGGDRNERGVRLQGTHGRSEAEAGEWASELGLNKGAEHVPVEGNSMDKGNRRKGWGGRDKGGAI